MTTWIHLRGVDLGLLPMFLSEHSDDPAKEQIDRNYAHGGGWRPFKGFKMSHPIGDPFAWALVYPGDEPMRALAYTKLRDETVVFFEGSWLAIIQPDFTYEVARVD